MDSGQPDSNAENEDAWKWLLNGWTVGFVILVLLVVVFYIEEDWRGAEAWMDAEADIAAHGESLDPHKLIPPAIPDAKNFAALPIFKLEPDGGFHAGVYRANALENDLNIVESRFPFSEKDGEQPDKLPFLGDWQRDEKVDLPAVKKRLADLCRRLESAVPVSPQATPAEMFDILCPVLDDLRAETGTYPDCQFKIDYTTRPLYEMPLGGLFELAKALAYEQRLAIMGGQPALAMADVQMEWKLDAGLRKQPQVVSGVISAAVVAIQLDVIREGLARHIWTDQQLATLDSDLGKIDFLADDQLCLRGDGIIFGIGDFDYFKEHRVFAAKSVIGSPYIGSPPHEWWDYCVTCLFSLVPNGWFDELKADYVRLDLTEAVQIVDPALHRVFPERQEHLQNEIDKSSTARFSSFFSMEGIANTAKGFAFEQVRVDEGRIACRLERYRLRNGIYPNSLDALELAFGSRLPRDVMTGQPYRYKLRPDGDYLLYSVGWDQIDDGGQGKDSNGQRWTRYAPDWVWPSRIEVEEPKSPPGVKR
jgi:hypothetical protein